MQFSLDFTDIVSQFLLNCAFVAFCLWAILRVPEKILDVLNKYHAYQEKKPRTPQEAE